LRLGAKPKVDSLSNVKYTPGGGSSKVFKEKLKFRENAQPRTDTHGIEMYAHLPTEFQEIARRLARQDNQLKEQKTSPRGRSLQRQNSTGSRTQSLSPKSTKKAGKKGTPGDGTTVEGKKLGSKQSEADTSLTKRPTLSRSSSIRSVPPAPKIHERHPSSSKITRPTPSQPLTTSTTTTTNLTETSNKPTKKKTTSKSKKTTKKDQKTASPAPAPAPAPVPTSTLKITTTVAKTTSSKSKKPKKTKGGGEKGTKITKAKREATAANLTKTAKILTSNTLKMAENTAKIAQGVKQLNESSLDSQDAGILNTSTSTYTTSSASNTKSTSNDRSTSSERTTTDNISSLSQYITENESFGSRPKGGLKDETNTNPLSSLCQYITEHELLDTSRRGEDISTNLMFQMSDNQFMETTKLPATSRYQTVQAH